MAPLKMDLASKTPTSEKLDLPPVALVTVDTERKLSVVPSGSQCGWRRLLFGVAIAITVVMAIFGTMAMIHHMRRIHEHHHHHDRHHHKHHRHHEECEGRMDCGREWEKTRMPEHVRIDHENRLIYARHFPGMEHSETHHGHGMEHTETHRGHGMEHTETHRGHGMEHTETHRGHGMEHTETDHGHGMEHTEADGHGLEHSERRGLHVLHDYNRRLIAYRDEHKKACYIDRLDETFKDGYARWASYGKHGRPESRMLARVSPTPIDKKVLMHVCDKHIFAHCKDVNSFWFMKIHKKEVSGRMIVHV